jgi:hypothetical protein
MIHFEELYAFQGICILFLSDIKSEDFGVIGLDFLGKFTQEGELGDYGMFEAEIMMLRLRQDKGLRREN